MKGIVFSLGKNERKRSKPQKSSANKRFGISSRKPDVKYLIKRYGSVAFFTAMLICGLMAGALISNSISKDTLLRLDFLFTTNLPDRLDGGAFTAFCASFASDFLFLLLAFLMGLCMWGIVALPFITFFKGFGIGVSAGYLFSTYGLTGAVFYLSVLLPGILVFSMVLVYMSSSSYNIFKRLCKSLFSKGDNYFSASLKIYFQKSFLYLLLSLFSALLDMILWCLFAGLFNFS